MAELSTATSAKLEVIDDGGRSWWMSPVELDDLGEIQRWLQAEPFEVARLQLEALGDQLDQDAKKMILSRAQELADDCDIMSMRFVTNLASVHGVSRMVWMSLRKNHPDITFSEATHLVTLKNVEAWQDRLDLVSGRPEGDADPTPEPETEAPVSQSSGEASSE